MMEHRETEMEPLWLAMERKIQEHASSDTGEQVIHKIPEEPDAAGCNESKHGGNMHHLRGAMAALAEEIAEQECEAAKAAAAAQMLLVRARWVVSNTSHRVPGTGVHVVTQ